MPPKRYEAVEEKGADGRSAGHEQNAGDLEITKRFAQGWWTRHLRALPHEGRPLRTLDIGSKYPWFAHCLGKLGCTAYALDAMDRETPDQPPIVHKYAADLGVPMLLLDFEETAALDIIAQTGGSPFDGVSLIHVFEHIYDAQAGLQKIADLLVPGGSLLIRMPDIEVEGFEPHLSARHYPIHPYYYSAISFTHALCESGAPLELVQTYPIGYGTRDYLLRHVPEDEWQLRKLGPTK